MKIKKDLKRFFNGIALEEKDILLQAAGVSPHNPKTHARAKLAVAALSVVALVLAAALLIGNMASSAPKNISPDNPSVLNSSLSQDNVLVNSTVTEENEELNINLPIVSCGRYTFSSNQLYWTVPPGEVGIGTMLGTSMSMDELQDDVLYAVCFSAVYYEDATENAKKFLDLIEEKKLKLKETRENAIAFIEKHAKDENHPYLEAYNKKDYYRICELIYLQLPYEDWPGQDAPEFNNIISAEEQIREEYEEKKSELFRNSREIATEKMYYYLEGLGVKFYEKTVYLYDFMSKEEAKEILSENVYRVAFLTKKQIKALKGGEDYGILVTVACEELAKMDNEPVYLIPIGVLQ